MRKDRAFHKISRIVLAAFLLCGLLVVPEVPSLAQVDKKEVRRGNRLFRKKDYRQADISYRKALVKDSTSFAANYNLASTQYRQEQYDEALKTLSSLGEQAKVSPYGADYYYNLGDVAIQKSDWKGAVDALRESLLRRPDDMDAKENYAYAKKMLEEEQQQGGGGGGNDNQQNQDQQNQDQQNQDQNQDQQNQDQQNQDQQNQQNQDQQNQDQQNQDQNQDQQSQGQQPQEVQISPQQAQQMLQAIQAKEKQTQDKVKEKKAAALKSRQRDKNW